MSHKLKAFMQSRRLRLLFTLFALIPWFHSRAQADSIIVSLAVPVSQAVNFSPDLLHRFEVTHPGVKVVVVKTDDHVRFYPSAAVDATSHFTHATQYASSADVLFVTNYTLSVEDSRASLILDLAPLLKADASVDPGDYVQAAWSSFQWDSGQWALPASADIALMDYDPTTFDQAGLAYPTANWTMVDLVAAAQRLTQQGHKTGMLALDPIPVLRSLLGQGFYAPDTSPQEPNLASAPLATLLDSWLSLEKADLTGEGFSGEMSAIPLLIGSRLSTASLQGQSRKLAALPGGNTVMTVEGFAVSGGTTHPDLAYALARFLTQQPHLLNPSMIYAWKSLNEHSPFLADLTSADRELIDHALPASEMRYADYVRWALQQMQGGGLDGQTALGQAQDRAGEVLRAASTQRGQQVLVVSTPIPIVSDQTTLRFNLPSFFTPLPNQKEWELAIQEFTSTDPDVKKIILSTDQMSFPDDADSKYDCFYPAYPIPVDYSRVLDLTPLATADPTFDRGDFIGPSLNQQGDRIWGFPLDLQLESLRYNVERFTQAGVPLPAMNWTMSDFVDALKTLKASNGVAAFVPHQDRQRDKYLLMLIAAYGGIPMDYRSDPPIVNFTAPNTITAIRQVLDLAKQGLLAYQKLVGSTVMVGGGRPKDTIYNTIVNTLWYNNDTPPGQIPDRLINYPRGVRTPISLGIGMGYVSAHSISPQACYRWLSFISKRPELLWGMPARQSVLTSTRMQVIDPTAVAYYKQIDSLTREPNAIFIPFDFSLTETVINYWLSLAFDHYVLNNADLGQELQQAQGSADEFLACSTKLPSLPAAASSVEVHDHYLQTMDCVIKVDPSPDTKAWFGVQP